MVRKIQGEQIRNLLDAVVYRIPMEKHEVSGHIFAVSGLSVYLQGLIKLGIFFRVIGLQLGQDRMQAMGQDAFIFQAVDQNIKGIVGEEKNPVLLCAPLCNGKYPQSLLVMTVQVAGFLKCVADTD